MFLFPHPFLKDADSGAGGIGVPAAGSPQQVPVSSPGASPSGHPMDARPGSITDDESDNLADSLARGPGDQTPRGKESPPGQTPSLFDEGFDPSTLEAPLQGPYKQMQAEFHRRLQSLPTADTMDTLNQQASAFQRLVEMPEFQTWASQMVDGESPEPTAGQQAADGAESIPGLSDLPEEMVEGIQNLIQNAVDKQVMERVNPIADQVYAREASATIDSLKEKFGAEDFEQHAPTIARLMEVTEGLDVTDAFKIAKFDELMSEQQAAEGATVRQKLGAVMEGDGSLGTEPAAARKVASAADATKLAIEMFQRRDPNMFDPTSLPPGYRE